MKEYMKPSFTLVVFLSQDIITGSNDWFTPDVNENEALVIASEWMQTTPPDSKDYTKCMKYGSDNSIWIAKIKISPEKITKNALYAY